MKSQKGVTLVELLVAISILLILSSVVYSVLIGANKSYNQISEKTSLQQEANIIISTIKNYQLKQDINYSYILNYEPTLRKTSIGEVPPPGETMVLTPLGRNDLYVTLKVDNDIYYDSNNPNFPSKQQIFVSRPLYIYLKIENKQNQSYEISTIIKRY